MSLYRRRPGPAEDLKVWKNEKGAPIPEWLYGRATGISGSGMVVGGRHANALDCSYAIEDDLVVLFPDGTFRVFSEDVFHAKYEAADA